MKKYFLVPVLCLFLAGCVDSPAMTTSSVPAPAALATFTNAYHGIELSYPKNWKFESTDSEGVLDVRISNKLPTDDHTCSQQYVGFFVVSTVRDTTRDFAGYVKANFDEKGHLGAYEGYMTPTTFKGYPAYKVGGFGWEASCGQEGYVVDYGGEHIVEVILEGKKESPDYAQLAAILDSLKLKGIQEDAP